MAPTKKKMTRTTKRKMIDQNLATITTNATLSAIENDNDNGIQTIQNRESEYQTSKHSENRLTAITALGHHQTWIIIKQTNIGQLK